MRSLLPCNASEFERALECVLAGRVEGLDIPLRSLWDAGSCPERLLPWLAHAVGVERWPEGYSVEQKRMAIAESVGIYRERGTLSALRRALLIDGFECRVSEGVRGAFTFGLDFVNTAGDPARRDEIPGLVDAVMRVKNERSHLASVAMLHEVEVGVRVGVSVAVESYTSVLFDVWQDHVASMPVLGGVSVFSECYE